MNKIEKIICAARRPSQKEKGFGWNWRNIPTMKEPGLLAQMNVLRF